MKTNKYFEFATIIVIQLFVMLPIYSASAFALTISNVRVTQVTPSSATIEWDTDAVSIRRAVKIFGKASWLRLSH